MAPLGYVQHQPGLRISAWLKPVDFYGLDRLGFYARLILITMTRQEKADNLAIALRICGFPMSNEGGLLTLDLLDAVEDKGDELTIRDVIQIKTGFEQSLITKKDGD